MKMPLPVSTQLVRNTGGKNYLWEAAKVSHPPGIPVMRQGFSEAPLPPTPIGWFKSLVTTTITDVDPNMLRIKLVSIFYVCLFFGSWAICGPSIHKEQHPWLKKTDRAGHRCGLFVTKLSIS